MPMFPGSSNLAPFTEANWGELLAASLRECSSPACLTKDIKRLGVVDLQGKPTRGKCMQRGFSPYAQEALINGRKEASGGAERFQSVRESRFQELLSRRSPKVDCEPLD